MISARRSEREEKVMQFKLELELEFEKVAIIECSERVNTKTVTGFFNTATCIGVDGREARQGRMRERNGKP